MKLEIKDNINYTFSVIKIGNDIPLEGRDKIVHKFVMGTYVITGKNKYPAGTLMVYIPTGTQLSHEYCKQNNLFDKSEYNIDKTTKGYISVSKRLIKAVRLGGYESNGLIMPLDSFKFIENVQIDDFKEHDTFDTINGKSLCNKYILLHKETTQISTKKPKIKASKIIENQFRFHIDTEQLARNLHKLKLNDIVAISYKIHGTSGISSRPLEHKPLTTLEKIVKWLFPKLNFINTQYSNKGIYSSRKVIKNDISSDYYQDNDQWRLNVHNKIMPHLDKGMTAYYEICGFTPNGTYIQKDYDYNCQPGMLRYFIYRLTYTNIEGKVFEFSTPALIEWCKTHNLSYIPLLWYGSISDYIKQFNIPINNTDDKFILDLQRWWYDRCFICNNTVPSEGIVLRKEGLYFEAYKYKNFKFLQYESKNLENNIIDIEHENKF